MQLSLVGAHNRPRNFRRSFDVSAGTMAAKEFRLLSEVQNIFACLEISTLPPRELKAIKNPARSSVVMSAVPRDEVELCFLPDAVELASRGVLYNCCT